MNKKIIPISLGIILASSSIVGAKYIDKITKENEELKNKLEINTIIANESCIEEVKEINKQNTKLIIYESSIGRYTRNIQEDKVFSVKSTITTNYSYDVVYDLSKAKTMDIQGITYIEIDFSNIKLNSIEIDQPEISNDLNFISQFKGNSISELNNQLIIQTYDEIESYIKKDFQNKEDTLKMNLETKVKSLYKGLNNVNINFTGTIGD